MQQNSSLLAFDKKNHLSRNLLIRFILGGATLIVSISAYFSYETTRNLMLKDLRHSAFLEVQRGNSEIEEWLHVRKVEVETLANTSTVHPDSALMSTVEKPAPSLLKIGDRNLNAISH